MVSRREVTVWAFASCVWLTIIIIAGWNHPSSTLPNNNDLPKDEPKNEPKKEPINHLPHISRENAEKIKPGMTVAEMEAILGESGWDESAQAIAASHRWTVKWALIEHDRMHKDDPKDPRININSWKMWVSRDFIVTVFLDQEMRALTKEVISLAK